MTNFQISVAKSPSKGTLLFRRLRHFFSGTLWLGKLQGQSCPTWWCFSQWPIVCVVAVTSHLYECKLLGSQVEQSTKWCISECVPIVKQCMTTLFPKKKQKKKSLLLSIFLWVLVSFQLFSSRSLTRVFFVYLFILFIYKYIDSLQNSNCSLLFALGISPPLLSTYFCLLPSSSPLFSVSSPFLP